MRLSSVENSGHFTINGECPHCSPVQSAFETVTNPFETTIDGRQHLVGVSRCIACRGLILAAVRNIGGSWEYAYHHPLGKPNDKVAEEVPENIRADFSEALRCQSIKAYNATVEMCRRAVESTCIDLGAPYSYVLEDMIDWLENNRKITPALKDVAHKIRLGGNRAAHPPEDSKQPPKYHPIDPIEEEHASALVTFTRHFLDHVYVIPKQLPTYNWSKPKKI